MLVLILPLAVLRRSLRGQPPKRAAAQRQSEAPAYYNRAMADANTAPLIGELPAGTCLSNPANNVPDVERIVPPSVCARTHDGPAIYRTCTLEEAAERKAETASVGLNLIVQSARPARAAISVRYKYPGHERTHVNSTHTCANRAKGLTPARGKIPSLIHK